MLELSFSRRLGSESLVILEPGSSLVKGHSFYGRGPVTTFSFVVLVGAFILVPGGCGLVFSFSRAHLAPVALAFTSLGAGLLVTTSEEVALGALKFWFRAVFAEVPLLLTVETFIFAACLYSIDVHGVRVFRFGPFRRSFLNEFEKLFSASRLSEICLKKVQIGVSSFF